MSIWVIVAIAFFAAVMEFVSIARDEPLHVFGYFSLAISLCIFVVGSGGA